MPYYGNNCDDNEKNHVSRVIDQLFNYGINVANVFHFIDISVKIRVSDLLRVLSLHMRIYGAFEGKYRDLHDTSILANSPGFALISVNSANWFSLS